MNTAHLTQDREWKEKYSATVLTADQAVARIKPGQRIFIGTGCAEPIELVRALIRRRDKHGTLSVSNLWPGLRMR